MGERECDRERERSRGREGERERWREGESEKEEKTMEGTKLGRRLRKKEQN